MPRAPVYSDALDEVLPRMRCTKQMKEAIATVADKLDRSMADVIRACIANSLGLYVETSEFTDRMFRQTMQGGEGEDG